MVKNLICVICPKGCKITAQLEGKKIKSIEGNACKRGSEYAVQELINPQRTLTTTVLTSDGRLLPVKTNRPVSINKLFACMHEVNDIQISLPVKAGSVIIENIAETGADIIATKNLG